MRLPAMVYMSNQDIHAGDVIFRGEENGAAYCNLQICRKSWAVKEPKQLSLSNGIFYGMIIRQLGYKITVAIPNNLI